MVVSGELHALVALALEINSAHTEKEVLWTAQPLWMFWRGDRSTVPAGIRTPYLPAGRHVTMSTTLSWLLPYKLCCKVLQGRNSDLLRGGEIVHTRPYWPWGTPRYRSGRRVNHPPPHSAEIKETVDIYLDFPSGPSWPVIRWPLPLIFTRQ
jgi:hypothetical protein